MPNFISEDQIEQEAVKTLVEKLGYRTVNCYTADIENLNDNSGRSNKQDVVFFDMLQNKAVELNPHIPPKAITDALGQFTAKRSAMSPIAANKEVHHTHAGSIGNLCTKQIREKMERAAGEIR